MAAKTSVDYYWRFEFIQNAAGSENAKIKIDHYHSMDDNGEYTIDTIASELEITSTDSANPTVWTGMCNGLAPGVNATGVSASATEKAAASDIMTHKFRVTLLNDYYLDESNDRAVTWQWAGYAPKWSWTGGDGDETKVYKGALSNVPDSTQDYNIGSDSNFTAYTPGAAKADYQECFGSLYEGDENGTVNAEGGWHLLTISTDYVSADLQTPGDGVWTW